MIIPELKGKNLNALTGQQEIYVPILESAEGATVRITGQKGGPLGLEKGMLRHVSGENYVRVGVKNLSEFVEALRLVTGGVPVKHAFLDASGKYHFFRTTEEFTEFLKSSQRPEVLGYRRSAAAAKADLLAGASAAEVQAASKAPAVEGKVAAKVTPTESKALAKTGLNEAKALTPGDANLGGLNEYGDVQSEVATTSVEAGFFANMWQKLFGTASDAFAASTGAPSGQTPPNKKAEPKRNPTVDPNKPLYPYQYDPGY